MKFNIARQTLVPAFLTLVALAAFAMWSAGSPAGDLPVGNPSPTGGELALSTPAELLARFQAASPGWSRWIGGFLILFVGMSLGRLTVRYNLYSVGTCLAIPLYGAITAGLLDKESFLTTLTAATLLALASRNYARECGQECCGRECGQEAHSRPQHSWPSPPETTPVRSATDTDSTPCSGPRSTSES